MRRVVRPVKVALGVVGALWISSCVGRIGSTTSSAPIEAIPSQAYSPEAGLQGRLIYTRGDQGIVSYDLASGQVSTIFLPPADSSLGSATVSPDGKWIVMAYAPPPPSNSVQFSYTGLYVLPIDGSSEPTALFEGSAEKGELYSLPAWSADGAYLYYGHVHPTTTEDREDFGIGIERIQYPDGPPEPLIKNAFWPRFSRDGSKMAYLEHRPGAAKLVIAAADGSNPTTPLHDREFFTVDSPTFSPDGKTIVFSAVTYSGQISSWWDNFLGMRIAQAHNVPSDLWSISTEGSTPQQLTKLGQLSMYPSYSPDGKHIAFLSLSGVYVMNPDGSDLVQLSSEGAAFGTLEWIP